jgi:hypothetical protein
MHFLTAGAPTASATTIDKGQSTTLTSHASNGQPTYTYQWYANYGSSATCSGTGNAISGATSSTYLASPTTTNTYAYLVTDSATTHVSECSSGLTITVNPSVTVPTLTLSNSFIDQGQSILFTANIVSGTGTPNYNYAFNVYATNAQTSSITLIANQLYTNNAYTSNNWFWTPNPNLYVGNSLFFGNVVVTDSLGSSSNSVGNYFGYNSAAIIIITSVSNTLLDSGQTVTFTLKDTGGTDTGTYGFNAELYNVTGLSQQGTNAPISSVGGSNTLSFIVHSPNSPAGGNIFQYNAIETDTGTTYPFVNNSIASSINVNSLLVATTPSMSNSIIDSGQYVTFTSGAQFGQPTYTYQWYSGTSATCSSDVAISGATGITYTTQAVSGNYYCYQDTDSATTPVSVKSPTAKPTVYTAPTASFIFTNTLADSGQGENAILTVTNGAGLYTANLINGTIRQGSANIIINSAGGSNGIYFITSSPTNGNTFTMNYLVTDYGVTSNYVFNAVAQSFTVNVYLLAGAPTASHSTIDVGQSTILTSQPSQGTLPYQAYQWYANYGSSVSCSGTGNAISGATSATYTASPITTNSYAYTVEDSATTPVTVCSSGTTITVNPAPSGASLSASNTFLDYGQSTLFTATISGGSIPYSYNYMVINSITGATIANQLYVGNNIPSNTWFFTPNLITLGNSLEANVIIVDTLGASSNSVYLALGYNSAPTLSISPSNTITRLRAV